MFTYKPYVWSWIARLMALAILLSLLPAPRRAYAQWPPFNFRLTPTYENGQITYQLRLSSQVDWRMADITIKIPLPEGTRFLKADAPPTTQVSFDGREVTFFTFHEDIDDAYFVVEIANPELTVFTTHAWIAWQGDHPGDYLEADEPIDITEKPLAWEKPPSPRVELEAEAQVANDIITYNIYPTSVTGKRVWDLEVRVPVPEGTTFLSAEAPPSFVAGFNGHEVTFSTLELPSKTEVGPLSFKVSTAGLTAPLVETHAWATWKTRGTDTRPQETSTGRIAVTPHTVQQVVADMAGDVPFTNYDLTSIALQEDGSDLKITFYTAGPPLSSPLIEGEEDPLEYIFYIDRDCRADTGDPYRGRGMEYRLRYRNTKGEAEISLWEETVVAPIAPSAEEEAKTEEVEVIKEGGWRGIGLINVSIPLDEQTVTMWLPYNLLGQDPETEADQFCWLAEAKNKTKGFSSNPPTERLPSSEDPRLTLYKIVRTSGPAGQQGSEAATQQISEAATQQVSEAAKQQVNEATKQQASETVSQRIGGLVH